MSFHFRRVLTGIGLLLVPVLFLFPFYKRYAYEAALKRLYSGTVEAVDPRALDLEEPGLILLDARAPHEYDVSRLPGAERVDFDAFQGLPDSVTKDRPVLVYCTVGYRSERVGEKLQAQGHTNVRHLHGGLVAWRNAGRLLQDSAGRPTEALHPYGFPWGLFID